MKIIAIVLVLLMLPACRGDLYDRPQLAAKCAPVKMPSGDTQVVCF